MVSEELIRQLFRTQDQAVIRRLSEISETVIYKKRQEIHKAGETYTHFYMLLRGAVYTYFYDEHQHPVVLCFFSESLSRLKAQMKQSEKEAKTLENILVTKDLQWDYMDIKEMIEKRQNGQG